MNTPLLLMLAAALPPAGDTPSSALLNEAFSDQQAWVFRAQSPSDPVVNGPMLGVPEAGITTFYPEQGAPGATPDLTPVPDGMSTPGTIQSDPFMDPGVVPYPQPIGVDPLYGGVSPYAAPAPMSPYGGYTFGLNGPQPHRLGWQARVDFGWLPKVGTSSPDVGGLGIFELDMEEKWTGLMAGNWVLGVAPQFNYRSFDGPTRPGAPPADLPGSAFRFGLGLTMQSPAYRGWGVELGFNPALATDFNDNLTSDGWQFDGHLVFFWNSHPNWMWALGAAYWDRVDDIVIPYAGAVWTPNDFWEVRLLFPESRVTAFLGAPSGHPIWTYISGKYHVESYQIDPVAGRSITAMQSSDWRIVGGLRWDWGWVTHVFEVGVVFDRKVEIKGSPTLGYDVDSGFIGRYGMRF